MSQPRATEISQQEWSTTAPSYAANVGRTSALSASRLLELTNGLSPITENSVALDVGAGAGAVTFAIASSSPWTKILATDISNSMLDHIAASRLPNVSTQVLDARDLSQQLDKASFTHVFNAFMLQTIKTPLSALQEMQAVLASGGVIGIGIWAQRNGPFEIWEQAARSITPDYTLPAPFDDPKAWRTRKELEVALRSVGFQDVMSEEVKMPFEFENAKAFIDFWFHAKNPAPVKCMSTYQGSLEEAKNAVERVVREDYADGKAICTWAVLGVGRR